MVTIPSPLALNAFSRIELMHKALPAVAVLCLVLRLRRHSGWTQSDHRDGQGSVPVGHRQLDSGRTLANSIHLHGTSLSEHSQITFFIHLKLTVAIKCSSAHL